MTPYYEQDGIVIYHGDCREILPAITDVDLVLTDPPYGIALTNHGRSDKDWTIAGDKDQGLGNEVLGQLNHLPTITFASPMRPWLGTWRQHLVWDKGPAVGGGGDIPRCWKFSWELIQVARTPRLGGPRDQAVLKYWVSPQNYKDHPAAKPLPLLRYLIEKASSEGGKVLDPFMGSGRTLLAAQASGRRAVGIEIDERYCEIAANRLQNAELAA